MSQKYRVFRVSKASCPTHVVCNGTLGTLYIGRKAAQDYIELKLGRKLEDVRRSDNIGQWIFKEPRIGPSPSKARRRVDRATGRAQQATQAAETARIAADPEAHIIEFTETFGVPPPASKAKHHAAHAARAETAVQRFLESKDAGSSTY